MIIYAGLIQHNIIKIIYVYHHTRRIGSKMLFLISSIVVSRCSIRVLKDSISAAIKTVKRLNYCYLFSILMLLEYFNLIVLLSYSSPLFSWVSLSSSAPRIWILLA